MTIIRNRKRKILVCALAIWPLTYPFWSYGPLPFKSLQFVATDVSVLQISTHSLLFHNRKVRIVGFLSANSRSPSVHSNELSYVNLLGDSIDLCLENDYEQEMLSLNGMYVLIEGNFDAFNKSSNAFSIGTICDVSRVQFWSDPQSPRIRNFLPRKQP
jgi:hypothetical protein